MCKWSLFTKNKKKQTTTTAKKTKQNKKKHKELPTSELEDPDMFLNCKMTTLILIWY